MHCVSCNTFNTVSLPGIELRSAADGACLNGARFTVFFFVQSYERAWLLGTS